MNRKNLLLAALLAAHRVTFAQPAPIDDVLGRTASEFTRRVEVASKELAEARNVIAAEKLPLVKAASESTERIGSLNAKIGRLEQQQSQFEANRKRLQQEGETLRKNLSYLTTLSQDSIRTFDEALLPGESELYRESIDSVQKASESPDTATTSKAAVNIGEMILNRLNRAVGGYSSRGKALVGINNDVVEGTFAFFGPEAYFQPDHAPQAGTVRLREGSVYPVMYALPNWKPASAEPFFKGQPGTVILDASGGKALQLRQVQGSVLEKIDRGGAVAYIIIIVGSLAAFITVMKLIELRSLSVSEPGAVEDVFEILEQRGMDAARVAAERLKVTTRDLFRVGFRHFEKSKELLEEHVFAYVLKQRLHFERRLPLLAVVATAAPLLGLLGTVTGMVKTFTLITVFGTGNATKLSSGISEALISTELGLIVAIPALIAHGFLSHRLHKALSLLERYSFEFVTAADEAKEKERAGDREFK